MSKTAVMIAVIFTLALGVAFGAPSVSNLVAPASVGLYDKFEIVFKVNTVATNLYWPYDASPPTGVEAGCGVSVDLLLSNDNWQTTYTKPAFYYQRYVYENHPNPRSPAGEWIYPQGDPVWCARFAPITVGDWRYKIRVKDAGGAALYPETGDLEFGCVPSTKHGPIRVSAADPRYFEYADGKPFYTTVGLDDNTCSDTAIMSTDYPSLAANGVKLLRVWWQSMTGMSLFGYANSSRVGGDGMPTTLLSNAAALPGRLLSWRFTGYSYPQNESGALDVYCKPNSRYRLSVKVRAAQVTGSNQAGVYWYAYNPQWGPVTSDSGSPIYMKDTNGQWQDLTAFVTTRPDDYLLHCKIQLDGAVAGDVYFSDFSIKEVLQDGSYGPELIDKPHPDVFRYYGQLVSWKCDRQLEIAEQNGIALKIVAQEKQDSIFGRILSDGTFGDPSTNDGVNEYSAAGGVNRVLQTYYWRYLIARFGHSSAVHSWELFNEADPFNSHHQEATQAFALYVHTNNPDRQLVTTSCWHSFPSAEFWGNPAYQEPDYIDIHRYVTVSGNNTTWFGVYDRETGPDCNDSQALSNIVTGGNTSGSAGHSLRVQVGDWLTFQTVPIAPGHTYEVKVWCKGQGIVWQGHDNQSRARMLVRESTGWHGEQLPNGIGSHYLGLDRQGSFDWEQYTGTFTASASSHYVKLYFFIENATAGTVWFDDVSIRDLIDGVDVIAPNSDFEYTQPVYGDSAGDYYSFGQIVASNRPSSRPVSKPIIVGETGITYPGPSEWEGMRSDISNLWLKKKAWATLLPYGVIEILYWRDILDEYNRWPILGPFYSFISTSALNNGHYEDARALGSNSSIRAWGQKDLTNNRAHLWIDNAPYTWKAVADHNYSPQPWSASTTYAKDSTCGGGSPTHVYKSLQAANTNHLLNDTAWWQDTGAFNAANNPPLPPPVSGSVTVSGLKDGLYTVEWWDTTAGTVTRTEIVGSSAGSLSLSISNVVSDVACKIAPAADKITQRLISSSGTVIPGETVTFTHEYTNMGGSDSRNVVLTDTVSDKMNYVAGSAEASGGTYDPTTRKVTWSVPLIKAGETGSRTFRATIK